MIGKTISHYRITGELGGGGMGIVYRATDTRLDRTVALKFLPPELTRDAQAKQRFIHEAKAASALQHHNICTIHEIGESDDGHIFIAMDCYEGETLKQRIARGPLLIEDVMDIATQVTEGLAEAHQAGMVHRDIKPANIMITEKGVVKILDFGLAKLAGQTKVTKSGTSVGTVAYMSPEQARGEDVDARSDIFSLGAVLYEALTGRQPFMGEHEAAVLYGIMNTSHVSISSQRTDIPDALAGIINRCMEKNAARRYDDASELLVDLDRLKADRSPAHWEGKARKRSGMRVLVFSSLPVLILLAAYFLYSHFLAADSSKKTAAMTRIAILPFDNLGPPEEEYFSEGMTEEIMARLTGIQGLSVIAQTSYRQYKNTVKSIEQIGEELDVDYILKGSVRWQKYPDRESEVRVTPKLIKVTDGTQVWADIYNEPYRDVFNVQADVARQVVTALNVNLLEREQTFIDEQPTNNVAALDYFMRGNNYFTQRHLEPEPRKLTAIQLYEKAIAEDPNCAQAYAMLAWAYTELYWHDKPLEEYELRATRAIQKAQSLSPDNFRVRLVSGVYDYHFLRYEKAITELNALLKLQPNNAELLAETAYVFTRKGDWERGIELLKKALQLDPRSYVMAYELALRKQRLRKFDEADGDYRKALQLAPDYESAYIGRVLYYLSRNGNVHEARQVLEEARTYAGSSPALDLVAQFISACEGIYPESAEDCFDNYDLHRRGGMQWGSPAVWGAVLELMGAHDRTEEYYRYVNSVLEKSRDFDPYGINKAGRAVALAGLGRKQEAVALAHEALQMASRNAWIEQPNLEELARVYILTGDYDEAVRTLDRLLTIPGILTVPLLRIDPRWAELRDYPAFQQMLKRHGT